MKNKKKTGTIRLKIKRGDRVVFIAGREYNRYDKDGKRNPYKGEVIAVDPGRRKVKVEGAMIVKKHQKANPQLNIKGGILSQEAWVDVSNVAHIDPKIGEPTRVGFEVREGKKVRIAKKSDEVVSEPVLFVKKDEATKEEKVEKNVEKEKTEVKTESKPEDVTKEKTEDKKSSEKE